MASWRITEAAVADLSALYPAPPQNNGLLSDPARIIGTIGALNQNALFQQEFAARKAIGQAYQDAIRPDGNIDTNVLMNGPRGIKNNPDAGFLAGEASAGALARTHQMIANTLAATELGAKQQDYVTNFIGSTATNPNARAGDIVNGLVALKRNIPSLSAPMINGWIKKFSTIDDTTPQGQADLQASKNLLRDWAIGPAALAQRVPGPPQPGTGAPTTIPLGTANDTGGGPAAPGAPPAAPGTIVGNRPGLSEAAVINATQGANLAGALTAANDTSPARKAILGNLENTLSGAHAFEPGPGADFSKVAKAFINRNVPLPPGWKFDPKSIASQEEFAKQAYQLAQSQFQAIGGTGTDAKLDSAMSTSPNELLSLLGNQGIIRLLKGNEDAIQAKNRAWRQWVRAGNGADSYADFPEDFNPPSDPRPFKLKYPNPAERQKYIEHMDPADRQRFVTNLTDAHKRGWIKFEGE